MTYGSYKLTASLLAVDCGLPSRSQECHCCFALSYQTMLLVNRAAHLCEQIADLSIMSSAVIVTSLCYICKVHDWRTLTSLASGPWTNSVWASSPSLFVAQPSPFPSLYEAEHTFFWGVFLRIPRCLT